MMEQTDDLNVSSIPVTFTSPDILRNGFGTAKSTKAYSHPVQVIEQNYVKQNVQNHKLLLAKIYGSHLPMKLQMEETILSQFHRPSVLPCSHLGLETLMGLDEEIDFGDFMNAADMNEKMQNPFEQLEQRHGIKL